MLEIVYVGDKVEMLVTSLWLIFDIEKVNDMTKKYFCNDSAANILKHSPSLSHQNHAVIDLWRAVW